MCLRHCRCNRFAPHHRRRHHQRRWPEMVIIIVATAAEWMGPVVIWCHIHSQRTRLVRCHWRRWLNINKLYITSCSCGLPMPTVIVQVSFFFYNFLLAFQKLRELFMVASSKAAYAKYIYLIKWHVCVHFVGASCRECV